MEYSTCKDLVITYSLASFKANIAKHSKSIDRISLGPVLLLHTRTLMTDDLYIYLFIYLIFLCVSRSLETLSLYPCS